MDGNKYFRQRIIVNRQSSNVFANGFVVVPNAMLDYVVFIRDTVLVLCFFIRKEIE